ncbi:WD repeat-containing protein 62 isoform X3 [Solea solea]|uniref:WD repeat-containing protein 62 isoform X3 n=1 Tax=Solea solea TaxID=90069 RepID=UPI00272A50FB|nr:WD repeat-containing protein 62 isoform X3 [Solea solea]
MAEGADCGPVTAAKRKQPAARRSRQSQLKKSSSSRVTLEKVLGISTASSSGLTSDPNSGLIAYPAGCVIVLLHPKTNKQTHIINTSRKPFSALAFSHDGKYLVTGESGHVPCVRVWEVGGAQVAEVQSHKYGVSCVGFSTNSCYIVSVGYQHDMTVSVWDWRKGSIIASNKVSSRVFAVSVSQDNSYFVTAGNRHVKFWYLDASKERRVNSTVPLIGRSGLLGEHKNSIFSGVACGRGLMASSTYCITSSGLLCLFNSSRHLEAWVDLKTSSASCLAVSEDFIFCGCADGVIRVFSPSNLQYITTLQRPHRLGVDIAQSVHHGLLPASPGAHYPDMLALTFDPAAKHLTCVYNDHSVYVWDVKDVRNVEKLYSALYHSSCVWSIEVYPQVSDMSQACLPPSSFLTCSADNTIRLWHTDSHGAAAAAHRNLYSNDLLKILYVDENTQHLQAEGERGEAAVADGKSGIRVLGISPDGQHLAAGDRCGNLRIFGLQFLDELVKIEAHDSEVLCLEFSPLSTGVKLLASASRDRLIHIFNLENNYSLEQTLNDHSASITAVKFTGESPEVRMVSCGADKSIYFQTAEQQVVEGLSFCRSHHVVEKTALYDMDLDSSMKHVAIACQDRNVRVYNVETGKLKKCLKGSSSDEGGLLKIQIDPSGSFFATSCSDKNIAIFDYESGECVATLFGHADIVTCMRFSQDCRHLITVSGDSCVFVWRLDSQMTTTMRTRLGLRPKAAPKTCSRQPLNIRRETFITVPSSQLLQSEEIKEEEEAEIGTPGRLESDYDAQLLQTNGKLPMWFRKLQGQDESTSGTQLNSEPRQVRSRWSEQLNPLTIRSNCSPSPTKSQEEEQEQRKEEEEKKKEEEEEEEEEDFHPQSLECLLEEDLDEDDGEEEVLQATGEERSSFVLYPDSSSAANRELNVKATTVPQCSLTQLEVGGQVVEPVWSTQLSPDSACSEGSAGSLDQQHDADTDSLSQGSSAGSLGLEDDDDRNGLKNHFDTLAFSLCEEKFDTDIKTLQPPEEKHFLNPRLSISARFLSRFQDRLRVWPGRAPPTVSIPTSISEENVESSLVNVVSRNHGVTTESTEKETSGVRCSQSALRRRASCIISQQPVRRPTRRRRHTTVLVQCRETVGDVSSRSSVVSAVQLGAPHVGYLGTTASFRAKASQDPHPSTTQEQEDVSGPQAGPDQIPTPEEQNKSVTLVTQKSPSCAPVASPQVLVTPTEVMSQEGGGRWSASSNEETPTNQNQKFSMNPEPSIVSTAMPTICDTLTSDCDITSCSAFRQGYGTESIETSGADMSSCASFPLPERLHSPQTGQGDADKSLSVQQCQQVANELRQAARRAVRLHQQLAAAPTILERRLQMSSILQEALDFVHSELQVVQQGEGRGNSSSPSGPLEDSGTMSLLEKYSELLVQMTRNKLNQI